MATDVIAREMAREALNIANCFEQNVAFAEGMTTFNPTAATLIANISEITIPDGVTAISQPAYDYDEERYGESRFVPYTKLRKITIAGSVKNIKDCTFYKCTQLQEVCVKEGVETISFNAFNGCTALAKVSLPSSTSTLGAGVFAQCTSLVNIVIPSGVASIGSNAFADCTNLTEITINKPEGSIEGAPWGATNATVNWLG